MTKRCWDISHIGGTQVCLCFRLLHQWFPGKKYDVRFSFSPCNLWVQHRAVKCSDAVATVLFPDPANIFGPRENADLKSVLLFKCFNNDKCPITFKMFSSWKCSHLRDSQESYLNWIKVVEFLKMKFSILWWVVTAWGKNKSIFIFYENWRIKYM